jgi:hypothetical protein
MRVIKNLFFTKIGFSGMARAATDARPVKAAKDAV